MDEAAGRLAKAYRAVALLLLNTLVFFLLVEAGATAALWLRGELRGTGSQLGDEAAAGSLDSRARLPYYRGEDWAEAYWTEFELQKVDRYRPWTIWTVRPFAGETINIGKDGFRITPGSACVEGAYTVYVFGGSTLWGVGAPDTGTIAAYLQDGLSSRLAGPVCVKNYGQMGYVNTQGVILLIEELEHGRIPDAAVFYDGINEVYGAYQSGLVGAHHNLAFVKRLFEERDWLYEEEVEDISLADWLRSTATFRLLELLVSRLGSPSEGLAAQGHDANGNGGAETGANPIPDASTGSPTALATPQDTSPPEASSFSQPVSTQKRGTAKSAELATGAVQAYVANYRIVRAMAEEYGFDYQFFWQPFLAATAESLTSGEKGMLANVDPELNELAQEAYPLARSEIENLEHAHWLADAFVGNDEQLWIDPYHITPEGNRIIAQLMLQVLAPSDSSSLRD